MSKRLFDIIGSCLLLLVLIVPILFLWIVLSVEMRSNGFFFQERVGKDAQTFTIIKFKTIYPLGHKNELEIGRFGLFLRKYKMDEWPQLINILFGSMSIVGPRPDLVGFYDLLEGSDRKVLQLRPGLTSRASIKYCNEVELLSKQDDPDAYNREVIFPDKVKMNIEYLDKKSITEDFKIIIETFITVFS